ncbi:MAG TPA: glutamine--fructose-6-phosphate transaminase (isomerizing) [Methylomirabilota bacterium]|nr:glutamine--fructose-6-phosphate transaminase (isomerizing) [Methylomirabilota bacterium]
MCGIVGYIGDKNAVDIVLEGLRRLEYRGYDSAGVAVTGAAGLQIRRALRELRGSYAIVVLHRRMPDRLVAAKLGAGSVVVGLGENETFLASDIPAILSHTRDVVVLEDEDIAVITRGGVEITDLDGAPVQRAPSRILWDPIMAEKGGYRHFMLKEIFEQPRAAADTMRGRVQLEGGTVVLPDVQLDPEVVAGIQRIVLVACGTSYHAAIVGRFMMERLTGIASEVDIGSEFRYRDAVLGPETLVIALSQSGETADTLGAVKAARAKGAPIVGITNVVGSALSREATGTLYTHAGPEIGVASSKTFTATLVALYLLALWLGRRRGSLLAEDGRKHIQGLLELPRLMEQTLEMENAVAEVARELSRHKNFLFLGRGINYPLALEGALKLKELSYVHAEGYPAGEMKHGPIALLEDGFPVIALNPRDSSYDRMMGNLEEVRAREGRVIAIGHEGDRELRAKADIMLSVPPAGDLLTPMLLSIPMQLLAYHMAVRLGRDVDQPRNLAKSVTVE